MLAAKSSAMLPDAFAYDRLAVPVIGAPMFIISQPGARDRAVQGRRDRRVSVAERAARAGAR